MKYKVTKSEDTHFLERKSSISQHGGLLCVRKKGEWCPLVADVIDAIKCGKIYSHTSAVTDKPVIGYTFPVGQCVYMTDLYLMAQENTERMECLPEWFGTGFYKTKIKENVFLNADNGALGNAETHCLRVGEDYVVAKKLLPADE